MKEVRDYLKECGCYFIATVDEEGNPRVRPFGTAEIFEDHLYIETGKKKEVFKQIMNHPIVELSACKSPSEWIRVTGKLVFDDRVEAKKDMLDKNPVLRRLYDENDDNTAVFYFESGKAVISSFTEEDRIIEF